MQSIERFAVFYQISTDSALARSLSDSWASCNECASREIICMPIASAMEVCDVNVLCYAYVGYALVQGLCRHTIVNSAVFQVLHDILLSICNNYCKLLFISIAHGIEMLLVYIFVVFNCNTFYRERFAHRVP